MSPPCSGRSVFGQRSIFLLAALAGGLLASGAGAQQEDPRQCGGTPGLPEWAATLSSQRAVYQGTLGTLPVVLSLGRLDDGTTARYFYERRGTNIELTPFRQGQSLILQEEVWGGPMNGRQVTGCLTLTRSAAGLVGSWTKAGGGGKLAVTLRTLNVRSLPLNLPSSPELLALRERDPLSFFKLNRAWVRAADGRSVREPLSGVLYPRLPGATPALNAALQDRQLENALSALDCRSMLGSSEGTGDGYEMRARVTHQTPRLISLREDVNYYCGGAHPDNFTWGAVLDRTTGRPVALSALWPRLTPARQKALYLPRLSAEVGADCRDILNEMDPDFTTFLTPAGLTLIPSGLPHVAAACAEEVTLPYALLRPEANPQGAYFRELYR